MTVSAISTTSVSPQPASRGGAMKSLVDGINSGDADAAKQALAKLRDDRKEASGGTQGAQHHRSHRTQAGGAASLTYSASATTSPTAAPGSTIDVSA
jgi:hypothetical protein